MAAYYRTQVSARVFNALDHYLWRLVYKWARFSHANKSARWVTARYFDRFNKARQDRWVFGDRTSGAYLHKFSWTPIIRHQIVDGGSSPDDPALADYWAKRRRRTPLPIDNTSLKLLRAQNGCCAICRGTFIDLADQPRALPDWEQWLATTRKTINKIAMRAGGTSDETDIRLIHANCRERHPGPALLPAYQPSGLA